MAGFWQIGTQHKIDNTIEREIRKTDVTTNEKIHHTFGDIQIEKVAIQNGLNTSGNDSNQVEETLEVVTPDPVD